MKLPERIDVLGSAISVCNAADALTLVDWRLRDGQGGYVCFSNVHTVVTGYRHPEVCAITNRSFLSVADGRPIYWVGRKRVGRRMGHVPGPDFFLHVLHRLRHRRHFFYGSTPEVLSSLLERLQRDIPGLHVCGSLSPPFAPLTQADKECHYAAIRASGAELVWVGLGAPKQERWMAEAWQALRPCVLLGVGAAFDFHAGTLRRAPLPMRRLGLEWLHRLMSEPRRLWRRYLVTNAVFLWRLALEARRTDRTRSLDGMG